MIQIRRIVVVKTMHAGNGMIPTLAAAAVMGTTGEMPNQMQDIIVTTLIQIAAAISGKVQRAGRISGKKKEPKKCHRATNQDSRHLKTLHNQNKKFGSDNERNWHSIVPTLGLAARLSTGTRPVGKPLRPKFLTQI